MKKRLWHVELLTFVFLFLLALPSWAAPLIVGNCKSGTRFTTIQAAVDFAAPGNTVQICPGVYPEQVVINKQLVVKGISAAGQGAPVIVAPATGLVPNFTGGMYGTVAVHLLVRDSTGVSISNVMIDGTGATCPAPAGWAGIAYESYSGSVTLTSVAVRNVGSYPDCRGAAVLSELGGNLTLQNSSIHGFYYGVVSSEGGTATINGNLVANGLRGIYVYGAAGPVVISNNSVLDIDAFPQDAAIFVTSAQVPTTGVTVSGNTVAGSTQGGIDLDFVANAKISGNKVSGFRFGLSLFDLITSTVQSNTIQNSETAIFFAEYGATGGNTLTKNTVNEASCGIMLGNIIDSTVTPNTLYNVTHTTCN
jgi:parallel beta-helix repeat protein